MCSFFAKINTNTVFKRKIRFLKAIFLLATLFFGAHSSAVHAAGGAGPTCTFTGAVSSAWGVADNWNCGIVPSSANDVIIPTGQSVDSSESGNAARGITIEAGGGLTVSGGTLEDQNSLQVNAGATFIMSAGYVSISQLSIYGTVEMNGGSILVLSGVNNFIGGTLTLNGGTLTSNSPFGNSGTINGSGTGALLDTAALVNSSDGVIDHTGGWQIRDSREFVNEGTYTSSADDSMFTFVGAPTTIPTNGIIYPNLRIQGSVNLEDGAILAVRRDILLAADSVLTANSSTLVVPRNWEARGRIIRNHLTVEFTGSTTSTIEAPTNQALFYNLVVNKDVPDKGIQLLSDVTVLSDFAQTQGLLDENSFNLFLPEACLFTAGGGTSAWLLAANWDCDSVARIPRASDRVTIPTSQTVILGNATTTIQSLDLESGAILEIRSGGFLNISATSTNAGTLNLTAAGAFPSPGLLALTGGAYGTSTNTGVIQGFGQGTFEVDVPLINGGTIDMSAGGVLDLKQNIHTLGDLDVSALGKLRLSGSGSSRVIPAVTIIGFLEVDLVGAGDSVMLEQHATTTGGADLFTGSLYLSTHTLTFVNTAYLDAHEYGNFVAYGVDAGTIAFTGTGDQTITSQFYNSIQNTNIQINKTAGSVTQNAQTQYIGFEIVSGTYAIKAGDGEFADYGGYFSAQSQFLIHSGATVSSTRATINLGAGGTNEGTFLLNNYGFTAYMNGTFTNSGTATFGGDYGFYNDVINDGTIYLPVNSTLSIHDFTNNGQFISNPSGTTLTLDSNFTAGADSIFNAPRTTVLSGPTTLPGYSYYDLTITSDVALVASTTVMATTTIVSGVALDLGTSTLNAPGDILNEGLITSSTGALLSHPIDYIRFSDSVGDLASSFTDSDDLYITVKDQGRNLDGAVAETMFITATSTVPAGADSEVLTLTETAPSSGIFRNLLALPVHTASVVTTGNGTFEVMADGQGRTTYIDAFDPADSLSTSVDLVGETIGAPPSDPPSPPISTGGGGGGGGTFSIQPVALVGASGARPSLQVLVNGSNASSSQTLQRTIRLDFNADPATVKGYAISLRSDFATASITPYASSLSYVLPEAYGAYSIYTKFYSTTGEASAPIVRTVSYQSSTTTIPVPDASPVTPVASDTTVPSNLTRIASAATRSLVEGDTKIFKVTLSSQDLERLSAFVEYGTSKESLALGFGERRAVIRDVFDTIGRAIPTEEIEKLIHGETASGSRNLAREQAQLLRARATFRTIYGHDPNFKNANENLAWNVLMYRIRFPRNVAQEQRGILKFKSLFGKNPTDPFQWATVRVLAYIRM